MVRFFMVGSLAGWLLAAMLPAWASAQGPDRGTAGRIESAADLKARIPGQLRATRPDFVVFVPSVTDTTVNDTGNEHFLVFDGPDGSLMAVWTQSSRCGPRPACSARR